MKNEWENEPNRVEFEHAGFKCLILRCEELLHLNGYVGLPKGHPYYGLHYSDMMSVNVHGGITFAGKGDGSLRAKKYWWVGFDTGHYSDYSPGMSLYIPNTEVRSYKNIHYVTKEVKKLAEQLTPINLAIRKLQYGG
jgi:hypothetical protein